LGKAANALCVRDCWGSPGTCIELLAEEKTSPETVLATRKRRRRNRSIVWWFTCKRGAIRERWSVGHRFDRWDIVGRNGIV